MKFINDKAVSVILIFSLLAGVSGNSLQGQLLPY